MPSTKCQVCRRIFDYADAEVGSTIKCVCGTPLKLVPAKRNDGLWVVVITCLVVAIIGVAGWLFLRARQIDWFNENSHPLMDVNTPPQVVVSTQANSGVPSGNR